MLTGWDAESKKDRPARGPRRSRGSGSAQGSRGRARADEGASGVDPAAREGDGVGPAVEHNLAGAQVQGGAGGDGENSLGFWRRLIWNVTRGIDAGESLADDAGAVLARVLGDVQHDLTSGGTPPRKPAAVVNAALGRAGLLDQLRAWEHRGVGSRPAA